MILSRSPAIGHIGEGRTCAHSCRKEDAGLESALLVTARAQTFGLVVDDSIVPDAAVSLSVCHRPWSGLPFYDPSPVWVYRSYLP
jgi:hypothetical protein